MQIFHETVSGHIQRHECNAAPWGRTAKSNATLTDDTDLSPDARVARAMDRVLEAERTAQAAVTECERTCAQVLERARQQRRAILEHAQARIVALHTRAAQGLALRTAELLAQRRQSAALTAGERANPARRDAALERLAARLTAAEEDQPRDGS